jgi:hypothetical protein
MLENINNTDLLKLLTLDTSSEKLEKRDSTPISNLYNEF